MKFFLMYALAGFISSILLAEEKFILITTLYHETSFDRQREYMACLEKNLSHPLIEKIHIFFDTNNEPSENIFLEKIKSKNVNIDYIKGRMSYQFCVNFANRVYPNKKIIIANADIYFNETLGKLNGFNLSNNVIMLSRWNVLASGDLLLEGLPAQKNYMTSDAWIFQTPCNLCAMNDIFLGTWQCDGFIAQLLQASGYKVLNPCYDIQACHLHASQVRNYHVVHTLNYEDAPEISWKYLHNFDIKNEIECDNIVSRIKKASMFGAVLADDEIIYSTLMNIYDIDITIKRCGDKKIFVIRYPQEIAYEEVLKRMLPFNMYCAACIKNGKHRHVIFIKKG